MSCSMRKIWYSIIKPYRIEITLFNDLEYIVQNNYHGNICTDSIIIYNPQVYFSLLHYYINSKKISNIHHTFTLTFYTKKKYEENLNIIRMYFDDSFLYG